MVLLLVAVVIMMVVVAQALKYLLDIAPEAVSWEDEKGDTPLTLGRW